MLRVIGFCGVSAVMGWRRSKQTPNERVLDREELTSFLISLILTTSQFGKSDSS